MQITIIDFMYLTFAIGAIFLTTYVVIFINRIMKTLDKADMVLDDLRNTTGEIRIMKDRAKSTLFSGASALLGILFGKKYKI